MIASPWQGRTYLPAGMTMTSNSGSYIDRAVCAECFSDDGIRRFVEDNATEEKCSFCGARAGQRIAAPLDGVAEFIEEGIGKEYGNPDECGMIWDSEDQRYYP